MWREVGAGQRDGKTASYREKGMDQGLGLETQLEVRDLE